MMTDNEIASVLADRLMGWGVILLPPDYTGHTAPSRKAKFPTLVIRDRQAPQLWTTPTSWRDWSLDDPAVMVEIMTALAEDGWHVALSHPVDTWRAEVGADWANADTPMRAVALAAYAAMKGGEG